MVTAIGGMGMPLARGKSDGEDRYELNDVSPGNHTVTAVLPVAGNAFGGRRLHRDAAVLDEEETNIDLDFSAEFGSIVGRVEVAGITEFGGMVTCTIQFPDAKEQHMTRMADGQFQFNQLPVGTAEITVSVMPGDPSAPSFSPSARVKTIEATVARDQET